MKDRTLRSHEVPLQSDGAAFLIFRLINPQAMGDACFARVHDRNRKLLIDGRTTIASIRAIIQDGLTLQIARHVEIDSDEEGGFIIVSKLPAAKFASHVGSGDLTKVLNGLWLDYSDF